AQSPDAYRCERLADQGRQMPKSHSSEEISWPGFKPVPGVNEMPRSTSPDFAVRKAVKLSLAGGVVALSFSLIITSLFGSAPWSPPPLTVEVMAQMLTVPLGLTWPVMLRRPSVAGDHGR